MLNSNSYVFNWRKKLEAPKISDYYYTNINIETLLSGNDDYSYYVISKMFEHL